jgi:uncharacterized membrane protein YjdF
MVTKGYRKGVYEWVTMGTRVKDRGALAQLCPIDCFEPFQVRLLTPRSFSMWGFKQDKCGKTLVALFAIETDLSLAKGQETLSWRVITMAGGRANSFH